MSDPVGRGIVAAHLAEAAAALESLRQNEAALSAIARAGELLVATFKQGCKVYSCGNGGSMCDAMHFAEELSGRFREDRAALGAMAISDAGHLSCVANDYGYEQVFARFVAAQGRPGDVLFGISTSGSSKNILRAAEAARARGLKVIVLSGREEAPLNALADVCICTPAGRYADRVQELHIKVIHSLIDLVERGVFEIS